MPWRCFRYDTVDSTNERAFDALAAGNARDGDVFLASAQSVGRGTRGRRWASAAGGLYLSVVLESRTMPRPGLWTIAGALAAHDLASAFGIDAQLQWPNDLVTPSGAKLAGVLAESRGLREDAPVTFVLGIGVNVERVPDLEAEDDRRTSSLCAEGAQATVADAETQMLDALAHRAEAARRAPSDLYQAFFDRCDLAGAEVTVELSGSSVRGRFAGLDPDGRIRLEGAPSGDATVSIAHVRSIRGAPSE